MAMDFTSTKWFESVSATVYSMLTAEAAPNKHFPDWDMKTTGCTLEAKLDGWAGYKESFFIEYESTNNNGSSSRPSGLATSKADVVALGCFLGKKPTVGINENHGCPLRIFFVNRQELLSLDAPVKPTRPGVNGNPDGFFSVGKIIPFEMIKNCPSTISVTLTTEQVTNLRTLITGVNRE